MRAVLVLLMVIGLGSCAQSPDAIPPASISTAPYQSLSCPGLEEEVERITAALSSASIQQKETQGADAVGIILLGLPLASMTGSDVAPEISRLKGEMEAVRQASQKKNCTHDVPVVRYVPVEAPTQSNEVK